MDIGTTVPTEPPLDLPALARRLGVNDRHVRRFVNERRIPFLKWGRLLRFDPVEIEACGSGRGAWSEAFMSLMRWRSSSSRTWYGVGRGTNEDNEMGAWPPLQR